jgi:hypothetical protein
MSVKQKSVRSSVRLLIERLHNYNIAPSALACSHRAAATSIIVTLYLDQQLYVCDDHFLVDLVAQHKAQAAHIVDRGHCRSKEK